MAIFLNRYGGSDYLYSIAEMTGLGVSTICCIVSEVANAVVETLWESEVTTHMPKSEIEFYQKISEMEQMWQFPCCWGAFDGCHVSILVGKKRYFNYRLSRARMVTECAYGQLKGR